MALGPARAAPPPPLHASAALFAVKPAPPPPAPGRILLSPGSGSTVQAQRGSKGPEPGSSSSLLLGFRHGEYWHSHCHQYRRLLGLPIDGYNHLYDLRIT
ncbi:hypothetical protein U9M48_031241 [Paspalum notatum var. saurae]|uniref:Uncharacterized protein n=1 Tax=Paspalum notatum var. saurae TaxID=547442 RepID=A0AAQ3U6I4_PASNO